MSTYSSNPIQTYPHTLLQLKFTYLHLFVTYSPQLSKGHQEREVLRRQEGGALFNRVQFLDPRYVIVEVKKQNAQFFDFLDENRLIFVVLSGRFQNLF